MTNDKCFVIQDQDKMANLFMRKMMEVIWKKETQQRPFLDKIGPGQEARNKEQKQ